MRPVQTIPTLSLLLLAAGCVEIGDIKVTIVGDSGLETGPPPTETGETDTAHTGETGETGETGDTGEEPVYESPGTFTGPPLGSDVLIFQGEGSLPVNSGEYLIDGVDELVELYSGLGADTTISETWPDDPSAYRLALWYLPGAAEDAGYHIPEETLLTLLDWLGRGGRLVLAGDVDTEYGGYSLTQGNDTIDYLLRRMGVDIRLNAELSETIDCEGSPGTDLLSSADLIASYLGHDLRAGPAAQWVYCDGIAMQNVWCGDVVVLGDVNLVSDRPDLAPALVENLYSVPVVSTCE